MTTSIGQLRYRPTHEILSCHPKIRKFHIFYDLSSLSLSRLGVGDKPKPCKQGVAGSIPGFSQSVG